jgi:hypothetical protein
MDSTSNDNEGHDDEEVTSNHLEEQSEDSIEGDNGEDCSRSSSSVSSGEESSNGSVEDINTDNESDGERSSYLQDYVESDKCLIEVLWSRAGQYLGDVYDGVRELNGIDIRNLYLDIIRKSRKLTNLDVSEYDYYDSARFNLGDLFDVISCNAGIVKLHFTYTKDLLEQKSFFSFLRSTRTLKNITLHLSEEAWEAERLDQRLENLFSALRQNQSIEHFNLLSEKFAVFKSCYDLFLNIFSSHNSLKVCRWNFIQVLEG